MKRDIFASSIEELNGLVGCVTHARLGVLSRGRSGRDAFIGFQGFAALRAADPLRGAGLSVRVFLDARERGSRVSPRAAGYDYALLDRDGVELLAYHWHPGRSLGADAPHVHVSAALRPNRASGSTAILPLDKRHLLTGPIPLAGFLRMLVTEFAAAPLVADWQSRLAPDEAVGGRQ